MKALLDNAVSWLSDRVPLKAAQEFASHKTVPVHRVSAIYYLGGMTMFFFLIQVMTGIMLINFDACPPEVEHAVEAQEKPLGHILIESGLLRHISRERFVKVAAEDPLVQRFELAEAKPAWGRLATIFADGRPAIDLLEIVRPEL